MKPEHFDTARLHAGYDPAAHLQSPLVPIYQTAAFGLGDTETAAAITAGTKADAYTYSRVGNPTVRAFEKRLAALDGGTDAVAVGSGMAAISYALLNVAEGGGRILAPTNIYGASLDEFRTLLPKFGIQFDFFDDINDLTTIKSLLRPETKAIYIESVANPSTEVADIAALAQIAHAAGIPLIVDNTFPTPYLCRPFEFGADIDVYSSTKGINGHGNVVSGVVIDHGQFDWNNDKFPQMTEPEFILGDEAQHKTTSFYSEFGANAFINRIRMKYLRLFGAVMSPFDAYLALLGLETISERLSKEVQSATAIAQYLTTNPHVKHVYYSGIEKDNQLVKKYFPHGIGAILSFELAGDEEQVAKVLDNVHVFTYLPNVGDVRSLIVNPVKVTHREMPQAIRLKNQLNQQVLRLSIGLEDVQDLIADLDQAIRQAFVLPQE
ncbi:O-acetylhomoserine aminocarboxypropyltransferase/cysteine synthase family protein [Loigolactobacillus coryniformis]|uniref:homocysteine desulfhydrase n=1 Tax=Loigolactobacillus coryniformis TaxID=1610 RepID=A0A5B8TF97_9LACO|nr:aminotransferase class I/II-fold pyridoxal phosphate-dependent enzyme [Loigolactobacillus coryniformis]QEA52950.1 O-acetylhomoserine aminocarboxypropyltransferase/cysteine synthase [Loigolactobacillus coryniformis]